METNIYFEINQIDKELGQALTDFAPLKLKPSKLIQTTIKLENIYGSIENIPSSELAKLHNLSQNTGNKHTFIIKTDDESKRVIKYGFRKHMTTYAVSKIIHHDRRYVQLRYNYLKKGMTIWKVETSYKSVNFNLCFQFKRLNLFQVIEPLI